MGYQNNLSSMIYQHDKAEINNLSGSESEKVSAMQVKIKEIIERKSIRLN